MGHRDEIFVLVVADRGAQGRGHYNLGVATEERGVSIGRRLGDEFRADGCRGPGLVFNNDGLLEQFAQTHTKASGANVDHAAGR